jgi:anaerobic ribonucleoside-triphosphate reductase activating protein
MTNNFNVLTITHPDVENGLGCRVTIWCAGCGHHCEGCHNPHTWNYNQGRCLEDVKQQIFELVDRPYIKGITLSGGDPLDQSFEALQKLLVFIDDFKKEFPDKDIWVFAGDTIEELVLTPIKRRILKKCDVLVDGRFVKSLYDPDLAFRGSRNQRIIDLKTLTDNNGNQINVEL